MTSKFSKWTWLLHTQEIEIASSTTATAEAREWADVVSVAVGAIEALGFDPARVCRDRAIARLHRAQDVAKTYGREWASAASALAAWGQ